MVGIHHRVGNFSPAPAQSIVTSGHPRRDGSPGAGSPVSGTSSLAKIAIAQVYLLLSTIRDDKDRTKWEIQAEQLRKLVDEHGMEVFQKYFSRLVVGNAPTIFPGINRPVANPGNYQVLVGEIRKIAQDVTQASRIAEAIETANEDLFRDFDLSSFMEHFKLDPLEKTVLALGFKAGSRSDLKTKADAILAANFQQFVSILGHPGPHSHSQLDPEFVATIIDRFIQFHPPNFTDVAHGDLETAIHTRYVTLLDTESPPTAVLAALNLGDLVLGTGGLVSQIRRVGSAFTGDEDSCTKALRNISNVRIDEEQVAAAILYTAISRSPKHSTPVLVSSLRRVVPRTFKWPLVVSNFDRPHLRITTPQFLSIFDALRPLARGERDDLLDIQQLWGGTWNQSETQLSFITAFASLSPHELDASTIPGLQRTFSLDMYAGAEDAILERAKDALRHPLSSTIAIQAIYYVALASFPASDTMEAKRLFQDVIVSNLDIFLVSLLGAVPRPWSQIANETATTLFDRFFMREHENSRWVFRSLWLIDRGWVEDRLLNVHARSPLELPKILEHAVEHSWLKDLIQMRPSGFTLDLAALAHTAGYLDFQELKSVNDAYPSTFPVTLMTFLGIKAEHEIQFRDNGTLLSLMLSVRTVSALLMIMGDVMPRSPTQESMMVQRKCITAYPRIINYGEGFDAILDASGAERNSLPQEAISKMEEHYKRMYNDDIPVVAVLDALTAYKTSSDPMDQDVFACMIHGLFDEYTLYHTYPLEALKTTALLFGGIIQYKLLPDLPLEIALGMIFDSVRDVPPEEPMFKFGLQALTKTIEHFDSWPGLCRQLMSIPALVGTEVYRKAEHVAQEAAVAAGMTNGVNGDTPTNGISEEVVLASKPPFKSISAEHRNDYDEPSEDIQEKVLFVLNNVTDDNLDSKFAELKNAIDNSYQTWFAGHLVEARAKMQPNYHQLYLHLVEQFESKTLWSEILRETYVSVVRMLNAESTANMASERVHLKNLGDWLGSITLARDQPIKYRNIAFKQLLHEGHHSQRLVVVLPFVCKVLAKAQGSPIFTAHNPWILDILRCLAELYQTELKLNLKFEIEVLFKHLGVTLGSVEPWSELQTLLPAVEETPEQLSSDVVDRFDSLSVSGMGGGVGSGRFSPQDIIATIPDITSLLTYPPANDMVDQGRLREIVRDAIHRAIIDIIAPVVERSVTIAAISTTQMIHKDFATEPDENRVKSAAINMVKRTAGALALVTSKEPLRASMSNYIRQLSVNTGLGLPEGTVIISVNANLDLACSIVEKKAEERAIPEIEEMIENELIIRREHRQRGGREPFVDNTVINRWAMTIPAPYKLMVNGIGLVPEQMAIYDEFARQPRVIPAALTHGPSSSDATRSIANDILHDGYSGGPQLPQTANDTAISQLAIQQQSYAQPPAAMANGRAAPIDADQLAQKIKELLDNIVVAATNTTEEYMVDLASLQGHPVLNLIDSLLHLLIRSTHMNGAGVEALKFAIEQACERLFEHTKDQLAIEALASIMVEVAKLNSQLPRQVIILIADQKDERLLNIPLIKILLRFELVHWDRVDLAASKGLQERSESALEFFSYLMNEFLLTESPIVLRTDFARSVDALNQWVRDDPGMDAASQLSKAFSAHGLMPALDEEVIGALDSRRDQIDYVFDEWCHLCLNPNAPEIAFAAFIDQLHNRQIINDTDSSCFFFRLCIDKSVNAFELVLDDPLIPANDAYNSIDALALLIVWLIKQQGQRASEVKQNAALYLNPILSFVVLVMNHHYVMRGEAFSQRVFFRLFSSMLVHFSEYIHQIGEVAYQEILNVFADKFIILGPDRYNGFLFAWYSLISHRSFMYEMLRSRNVEDCGKFVDLLVVMLKFVGEMTKPLRQPHLVREMFAATAKILVSINHDFPQVLAANHTLLCRQLPVSCIQLQNVILTANPSLAPVPDVMQPGLKLDRLEGIRTSPVIANIDTIEFAIKTEGLLELIDQALQSGPSEDAVAHIAHAMQRKGAPFTSVGYVPVAVNTVLIDSVVLHIGIKSIEKSQAKQGPIFVSASPDAALLSMLVHELNAESRYFFLSAIVNQLRYVNMHTHYFTQALLELFGTDLNDPEDLDIKQQIVRIILERAVGAWPQPWGLISVILELVKNDKYMFFELPFIKADPNVAERFSALVQRTL